MKVCSGSEARVYGTVCSRSQSGSVAGGAHAKRYQDENASKCTQAGAGMQKGSTRALYPKQAINSEYRQCVSHRTK
ncbi:uncharacterized protein EI97DRAFT_436404 [Westerdykella ornata]|uniref:Uncharacterized protein n=1 Tax=Westerdykella ornata TaxID=318751 RepID=A0A6A6JCP5_WESOR|nr:uncharacterized protein EI97DRAFT_436404 [Westerdykella ornata]KAF2272959.1 hypothetical protein EI97DRAFT_436404 [Westerdykella ornata]